MRPMNDSASAEFRHRGWRDRITPTGWLSDLRQARRSLARSWVFSLTTISILGVGLGAATAIFSICYGILVRPLPYSSPEALAQIDWVMRTGQSQGSSLADLELWGSSRAFSDVGLFSTRPAEVRTSGPAEMVQVAYVSAGTLPVLGVRPRLGRFFYPAENVPNGDVQKVILSDALWRSQFGEDPQVLGERLRIGEKSLEIIGVMPPGFDFPNGSGMWVPVENTWATTEASSPRRSTVRIYGVTGRLRPGVTRQQAQDELAALAPSAVSQDADAVPRIRALREAETDQLQPYLIALAGGVGCLLLICIANVGTMQLARGAARQREFAIRTAIGAPRARNLRIQLAESLLLAIGGAAFGSAVAYAGVPAILSWIPVDLPSWMRLNVDAAALAFCWALAVLAAVLSGLLPALRSTGQAPGQLLSAGGRGRTDRNGLRQGLVVAEIGLSVLLLVSALLLIQTLLVLQQRDPGFPTENLLTIRVSRAYGDGTRLERAGVLPVLHNRVLERLDALPGVISASLSSRVPFAGGDSRTVADLHISSTEGEVPRRAAFAGLADVSPEYFSTIGFRVVRGRGFTPDDASDRNPVIVINERLANELWPNEDALGQQITWGLPRPDNPPATVVGIVANVRSSAGAPDHNLDFYYPYAQYPVDALYYVLRTSVRPQSLAEVVRKTIQEAEPSIAVAAIKPLDQWIAESLWLPRLWARLLAIFAAIALMLAAAGLYGVVSYLVLQRSKELVIRMSIGATGRQIAALLLGGMLRLVGLGVAAGVAASLAVSPAIGAILFQVSATGIRTYLLVAMMVTGVALLACCPPILRASRVNPMSILNKE